MKTSSGKEISKIGIGTYGIGGRGHRDMDLTEKAQDEQYVDALVYTLEKGFNFTEISLGYGHGNAISLFKKSLDKSSVLREDIFITHSLYPRDLSSIEEVNKDIESFYTILNTDYADSTLITQSFIVKFGEEESFLLLNSLLDSGKTRFVSLSNASPECIRNFKIEFGDKFYAHEGHLSFEVRALQEKGVFEICEELSVKNIIWRPFRRGETFAHNWELLTQLSNKYSKTQSQIILNWMCHLAYSPMVFSINKSNIDENFSSMGFKMAETDYSLLTNFRPQNYYPPKVDWDKNGDGDSIVTLVVDFEKHVH